MPVELCAYVGTRNLVEKVAAENGAVDAADYIEMYALCIFGVECHMHAVLGVACYQPFPHYLEVACRTVDYSALAYTVAAAEYVHVGAKLPVNVLAVAP